ncbi:hypothetical protein [Hymenobacter profundi]|uniref:Outer membrane protein beta-barrel domain-containing protein n=1 Tax=Hymenobacter profundi TaxID=1982110 RepID=A0ABS6X4D0_9BACT|nr:hypothetical protein [Hymenobacter profundi]MBW3130695.1 hypothetical protein [Hymenobacter profundi]
MRYALPLLFCFLLFSLLLLPDLVFAQTTSDSTRLRYSEEVVSQPMRVDTAALRVQREDHALWKLGLNNITLRGYQRYGVHLIYERKVGRPAWSVMGEMSPSLLRFSGNHFSMRTQLAGRYYYNLERRIRQGRNAGNFSANYFSVALGAGIGHYSDLPFYLAATDRHWVRVQAALLYGMQRRLGRHGFFDVNVGFAKMLDRQRFQQITGSVRVGFLLEGSTASRAYVPPITEGMLIPRAYLGVQAGVYGYGVRYDEAEATSNYQIWAVPYLYAGYYLKPRLAVQLGMQASRRHSFKGSYYYGTLFNSHYKYEVNERFVAVPALLRYTITKLPQQHIQIDVLAGATLTAAWARYQRRDYNQYNHQISEQEGRDQGFGVNSMVGIGGAYGFGRTRRVQATAEAVLIKPLFSNHYGFEPGVSVGLRYRFQYQ